MQNLIDLFKNFNFKGVSFVSLKGYSSDKSGNSEVADVLINVGTSYANMKKADIETLKNAKVNNILSDNFGKSLLEEAIAEKLKSLTNPSENHSNGQKEAYINLNEQGTIKLCKETNSIIISGTVVRKTVIVKGEYKTVNSKPLTLAKKYVETALDLKTAKMRYYKLSNVGAVKTNGDTIEF